MKLKLNLYKLSVYIRKRLAHNQDDLDRTLILESGLFDPDFYRAAYPDIADIADPLLHFIISGADEGRRPNARFDTKFYADTVSNKREWRINPLVHYLLVGRRQGVATVDPREIGPASEEALVRDSGLFDEAFYREEIVARRNARLPPFGRLAAVIVSGADKAEAEAHARAFARAAPASPDVQVLGPAEAALMATTLPDPGGRNPGQPSSGHRQLAGRVTREVGRSDWVFYCLEPRIRP